MSGNANELSFVDTNIFLYAYDKSLHSKQSIASQLIKELWVNRSGCLSVQVLQELYVNLTRKIITPLSIPDARQIVSDLNQWQCFVPNGLSILGATEIQECYQISFWDAMVIYSAKCLHCEVLWSEDLSHNQDYSGITVINPFKK
jgi:predicted nucleic acid-binding protein